MKAWDFSKEFRKFKKNEQVQNIIDRYERGIITFSELLYCFCEIDKELSLKKDPTAVKP